MVRFKKKTSYQDSTMDHTKTLKGEWVGSDEGNKDVGKVWTTFKVKTPDRQLQY